MRIDLTSVDNQNVLGVLEYAQDSFIFTLQIDLMVVDGWDGAKRVIKDPVRQNINK